MYQQRIPQYARGRYVFKAIQFLLTTAASAVSAYGLSVWALVIASAAAALTSWTEFSDIGRKIERYTRAVVDLENLVSRWKSLAEVEKASPSEIHNLVMTAESIISDERVAWVSTVQKFSTAKETDGDTGKGNSNQNAKPDSRQPGTTSRVHPL